MIKLKIVLLFFSLLVARLLFNDYSRSPIIKKNPNFIVSNINKTYHLVLPFEAANLLSGVVLGNATLDREFKTKLASVGLSHVVAASCMNVTFVYGISIWFLSSIKMQKLKIFLFSIPVVLFYMSLTGFDPPIVRAGLMCSFVSIGNVIGRQ
ncbi:ComEC/Rec2 family competence protein, partial [Candidatus Microgenomates bacterium]|nr:ComEC/Rec2 family competence protein [Candidatus Microgenomates bacterium]